MKKIYNIPTVSVKTIAVHEHFLVGSGDDGRSKSLFIDVDGSKCGNVDESDR